VYLGVVVPEVVRVLEPVEPVEQLVPQELGQLQLAGRVGEWGVALGSELVEVPLAAECPVPALEELLEQLGLQPLLEVDAGCVEPPPGFGPVAASYIYTRHRLYPEHFDLPMWRYGNNLRVHGHLNTQFDYRLAGRSDDLPEWCSDRRPVQ
jgi:hypothetical protein